MTTDYTSAEIQRRLEALPPDIRNLIYGTDVGEAAESIGNKHSLHIDQVGALEAATINTMIGFVVPQDFPDVLAEDLGVDPDRALAIAHDIDTALFQKIREQMKATPSTTDNIAPIATTLDVSTPAVPHNARVELDTKREASLLPVETYEELTAGEPLTEKNPTMPVSVSKMPTHPAPNAPQINTPSTSPALHTSTVSTKETVDVGITPGTRRAPTPPPTTYTSDPYREPIQ